MYELDCKGTIYTIPKENIGLLAFVKAQDHGKIIDPKNKEMAIEFLESIGIKVKERENV